MRRAFWILAVMFVGIGVPNGRADTYTPVFTCSPCTSALPTAPDVSFPAPLTLDITWENTLFVFSLPSSVQPTEGFDWMGQTPTGPDQFGVAGFTLFDVVHVTVLSPFVYEVDSNGNCLNCQVMDSGRLTFVSDDATATPEPSSIVLMLAAIAFLMVVMRKRFAQSHRRTI